MPSSSAPRKLGRGWQRKRRALSGNVATLDVGLHKHALRRTRGFEPFGHRLRQSRARSLARQERHGKQAGKIRELTACHANTHRWCGAVALGKICERLPTGGTVEKMRTHLSALKDLRQQISGGACTLLPLIFTLQGTIPDR